MKAETMGFSSIFLACFLKNRTSILRTTLIFKGKVIPQNHDSTMTVLCCLLLFYLCIPQDTNAAGINYDCVIDLNQNAIESAVSLSPPELKKILSPHLGAMKKEIRNVQWLPSSQKISVESHYKTIIEIAREKDSGRYEYMARAMSSITNDIFYKYSPIRAHDYCNSDRILNRATVVIDGYNLESNYLEYRKSNFDPTLQYAKMKTDDKLVLFYNIFVNAILSTWISIWDDAGRDISELPVKGTMLKVRQVPR